MSDRELQRRSFDWNLVALRASGSMSRGPPRVHIHAKCCEST
jgi:hypothetical protein